MPRGGIRRRLCLLVPDNWGRCGFPLKGPQRKRHAMPAGKKNTISATCPKCGQSQPEPRGAYSTVCKHCQAHFRIQETPKPARTIPKPKIELQQIKCFQCGTEMSVPLAAESSMCKRCSSHIDLRDYQIAETRSKNIRTYGRLVLEEKGYLLNSDTLVRHAVIKGRFIGKLVAEETLELHTSANIKGTFNCGCLVIPTGHHFRWKEPVRVGGADIAGEFVAHLITSGTVRLKSSARFFGDIEAGNLVVESGAVFVGNASIGTPLAVRTNGPLPERPPADPAPKTRSGARTMKPQGAKNSSSV